MEVGEGGEESEREINTLLCQLIEIAIYFEYNVNQKQKNEKKCFV